MTPNPNKPAPAAPARPTEAEFVAALNALVDACWSDSRTISERNSLIDLFRRARGDEGAMAERDLAREQLAAAIRRAEAAEAQDESAMRALRNLQATMTSEMEKARAAEKERNAAVKRAEAAEAIIKQHDLCHNLQGKVDAQSFADGCAEFQRKLYGCAPHADALAAARTATKEALQRLREAASDQAWRESPCTTIQQWVHSLIDAELARLDAPQPEAPEPVPFVEIPARFVKTVTEIDEMRAARREAMLPKQEAPPASDAARPIPVPDALRTFPLEVGPFMNSDALWSLRSAVFDLWIHAKKQDDTLRAIVERLSRTEKP